MALIVFQHQWQVSDMQTSLRHIETHLLRTFLVDVLEGVLSLVLVLPDKICESPWFARLGVRCLLDVINVVDVVLPRAGRWAPLLFCLDTLDARCGSPGFGLGAGVRLPSLALLAFGLWSATNSFEVLLEDVGRRFPAIS